MFVDQTVIRQTEAEPLILLTEKILGREEIILAENHIAEGSLHRKISKIEDRGGELELDGIIGGEITFDIFEGRFMFLEPELEFVEGRELLGHELFIEPKLKEHMVNKVGLTSL